MQSGGAHILTRSLGSHRRELWVAAAIGALFAFLAIARPAYFGGGKLRDLFLTELAVLVVAAGMTLVMLTGEIDISVESFFAVCAVAAGMLAKAGLPTLPVFAAVCGIGAVIGLMNGSLVAYLRLP